MLPYGWALLVSDLVSLGVPLYYCSVGIFLREDLGPER